MHTMRACVRAVRAVRVATYYTRLCMYVRAPAPCQVNYERNQPSEYEHAVVQQCFRFLSSETDYTPRAQHLLLRCLQANEPKERQAFFSEVRACRRRRQDAWEGHEVAAILREPNEFALFELRALLAATHRRLRARGLAPRQAFHAFNSSRTGLMSCSELYSALRWLQLQPSVDLVHEAMRRLDTDDDGCLTVDDFVCALQRDQPAADADADAAAAAAAPSAQHLVIPFSRIRELYAEEDEVLRGPAVTLSAAELAQFVAMLRAVASFDRHVGAGGLSAWSPSLGGAGRATVLVPLGHYVRESAGGVPLACQTLEVRDMKLEGGGGLFARDASRRLQARLDRHFPPPLTPPCTPLHPLAPPCTPFHCRTSLTQPLHISVAPPPIPLALPLQAYLDQNFPPPVRYLIALIVPAKGAASLVLWKPLPPTPDFVALGMVATAHPADAKEPKPPPYDAVRCVPKAWARKAAAPEVAWQGSAGTVWRTRHNLLVGAKGRQPPPMYELPRDTFSSDSPNPP